MMSNKKDLDCLEFCCILVLNLQTQDFITNFILELMEMFGIARIGKWLLFAFCQIFQIHVNSMMTKRRPEIAAGNSMISPSLALAKGTNSMRTNTPKVLSRKKR